MLMVPDDVVCDIIETVATLELLLKVEINGEDVVVVAMPEEVVVEGANVVELLA